MKALFLLASLVVGDWHQEQPYARVMGPTCTVLMDLDIEPPFDHPEYTAFWVYCEVDISGFTAQNRFWQYVREDDLEFGEIISETNGLGTQDPDPLWLLFVAP